MEKQLGFLTVFSLVVGIVIGSGILVLPSIIAQYGYLGFWAWPITSIAVLNLAFIFAHLSKTHPNASGLAGYIKEYFGDFAGFQASWVSLIGMCMGLAIIAISFSGYFSAMTGLSDSIWLALGALWIIFLAQVFSSSLSDKFLIAVTIFKIVAIGSIVLFGINKLDTAILTAPSTSTNGITGLIEALALVLFTFIGIECATLPGANVKNPGKIIPLATITGTVLAACLFTLLYWVVWSVLPTQTLIESSAPVAQAALILMGTVGHKMISAFAVIGCLGSVNGCLLGSGHVMKGAALQRWMPAVFAHHSRSGFPVAGALLAAIIATIAIIFYYNSPADLIPIIRKNIAQLEVFLIAIVYLTSCIAYKLSKGNKFIFFLGLISCTFFIYGSMDDKVSCIISIMTFLSSIPVFAFAKKA